jgi:hypothetical protein
VVSWGPISIQGRSPVTQRGRQKLWSPPQYGDARLMVFVYDWGTPYELHVLVSTPPLHPACAQILTYRNVTQHFCFLIRRRQVQITVRKKRLIYLITSTKMHEYNLKLCVTWGSDCSDSEKSPFYGGAMPHRSTKIFQKSRRHLKIIGAREVT